MYPSTNTQCGSSASIQTFAIALPIPTTYPTSTSLTNSDLEKFHTDIKSMNDRISAMLAKIDDRSIKTDKQE